MSEEIVYYSVCNCGPCPIHNAESSSGQYDYTVSSTVSGDSATLRETLKPLTWRQRLWRRVFG